MSKRNLQTLTMLFTAFGKENEQQRLGIYYNDLRDVESNLLFATCQKLKRECAFLPSLKQIFDALESMAGTVNLQNRTASWAEARAEIESKMWKYGCTGKEPPFADKNIASTVRAMGGINTWALCEGDISYIWHEAEAVYKQICQARAEADNNRYALGGMTSGEYLGMPAAVKELADGTRSIAG